MIYRMGQGDEMILTSPPGSETKIYRPEMDVHSPEGRVIYDLNKELKPVLICGGVIGAGLLALKLLT